MHNNGLLTSWDAFLRALELRFAPSKFEDPIAALCKLSQTQLLQDYITEFESIANRISGYPASFYLSCFISGLKPHLRREVTALQPTDMPQAVAFAKLHDIKRLIEAEMQDRRDKNLCYNYDERYTRDHRCKSQFLLLVVPTADDISDSLPVQGSPPPDDPSLEAGLISLHSLSGQWTPQTFRITGSLKGYEVHIMVDSRATHNFIQSKVVHFLNLPLKPTSSPLKVMVGNGDFLLCTTYCPQAQITLASLKFPIDLYPLDLSGTDIVLGVQWLTQISPFIMDYNVLCDKDTNSTPSRATATYPNTRALLGRFVTGFYTHLGVSRILSKLQANFYWANMRKDVHAFVSQCTTCQQTKTPTRRPPGLLQPIPTPERCWEDLSLDFIQLKNNPLVFKKYKDFKGLLCERDFEGLSSVIYKYQIHKTIPMVCKLHGFPRSLILDRDPIFFSQFWRELFRLSGTKLHMSTAYHPQTDGQTKVANKILQQYLRSFVHHRPSLWGKLLPWAEWCFNTTVKSSTGLTPFEAMFGHPPPNIPQNLIGDSLNVAAHSEVTTRDAILRKLHSNLHKAQEAMKRWADTCRRDLHFDIGDLVYVRLRPRRQASVTGPYLSKLQKRYFSPFKVLEKVGNVAYKLDLPPTARIHNVFHISLLQPLSLPPDIEDNQPILEPAAILNWKLSNDPDDPQQLVLIQWQGFPLEETSWEPWSQIKAQFHLEDKATLEPGGGVRPISQYDPPDPLSVQEEVITYGRPQRIRNKPPHLDDYVTE
uniref:Transposon Ty3-G Gag-Pol polyprotein n=1 Tax=Cajanus cajan TaxID=3821 RepID=A0A151TBT8_CAJCA|nr:Transposon Ty3-G Gag-Pol polyprotein [Cajanus cajan]